MNAAIVKKILEETILIDGAVGACLVDYKSGMCLGTAGGHGLNLEIAAAGDTEIVKAEIKAINALGLNDVIEDILITLGTQYHLIRLLSGESTLFIYLILSKANSNLAMARLRLGQIEKKQG